MAERILVLSTGGTIEMAPGQGGLVIGPGIEFDRNSAGIPEHILLYNERKFSLPSPHMTPVHMLELTARLQQLEASREYQGVVVTHGTDTLEESAFLADLHLRGTMPVVFTAAMRSPGELGVDGPRNLRAAILTASSEIHDFGVTVVLGDEIHAAGRVTKTCTSNTSSFSSPGYGPLGFVDEDGVILHRKPLWRLSMPAGPVVLDSRVGLVRCAAGFGGELVDHLSNQGYKGLVIEAFGRGNMPPETASAVKRAIRTGMVVAITSRCYEGRVLGVYAYEGGCVDLVEAGAITAGDMQGHKIRLLLMSALGRGMNAEDIRGLLGRL